jgi:phage gpG-like protein
MKKALDAMKSFDGKKLGVWRVLINHFTAAVQENFKRQGRPSWPALKDTYSTFKHATFTLKGGRRKRPPSKKAKPHPILQLTQRLRKAATGTKSAGWFQKTKKESVEVGIRGIPYSAVHNFGSRDGTTPRRTYFVHPDGSPAWSSREDEEAKRAMSAVLADSLQEMILSKRINM